MVEETRIVLSQDMQMVASAMLKEHNGAGNRLVGISVGKKEGEYYEIRMIFDSTRTKVVNQKIVIELVAKGKSLIYADSRKDAYAEEGYVLTIMEISSSKVDFFRDFVLMVFEK